MTAAKRKTRARASRVAKKQISLKVEPFGPGPRDVAALVQHVTRQRISRTTSATTIPGSSGTSLART